MTGRGDRSRPNVIKLSRSLSEVEAIFVGFGSAQPTVYLPKW